MIRNAVIVLLLGVLACSSDSTGPTEKPPSELNILRLAPNHPPFEATSVGFWARRGDSREGKIYFLNAQGARGEEFARLKIDSESLSSRPDGTPIALGDSIFITMTVVDQSQLLVELQPSGLRFSSSKPAELKLDYGEADDDYNHDGRVDEKDSEAEQQFAIWRQEKAGAPFVKIGSVKVEELKEVEAKLLSFSRYAIAY
jgi:hypothetical protein